MAIHGDLSSFPLPDLLQWVDASRKTGALHLTWDVSRRTLFLRSGQVFALSSPGLWERTGCLLAAANLVPGERTRAAFNRLKAGGGFDASLTAEGIDPKHPPQLAREELLGAVADLVRGERGQFHWSEQDDPSSEEWIPVEMGIRELLFESLRWVDEQAEIEKALPSDSSVIRVLPSSGSDLPLIHQIVLTLCQTPKSLGRLRLLMGSSRSAVTRRVFDLLKLKRLSVEGSPAPEGDPISQMLDQGAILVQEGQFDAASLVFSALLASDPSDHRVRQFALWVEQEQVAALYKELPPLRVPDWAAGAPEVSQLRPDERYVGSLINGSWDVATIVLASQSHQLETLKVLAKLYRLGLLVTREDAEARRVKRP